MHTYYIMLTSFVILIYHMYICIHWCMAFWYVVHTADPTSSVATLFVFGLCLLLLVVSCLFDAVRVGNANIR